MTTKNSQGLSILDRLRQNEDDSLPLFLSNLAKFDRVFCDLMAGGSDFTIKLEVRGSTGKVSYCKTHYDSIDYATKSDKATSPNNLKD